MLRGAAGCRALGALLVLLGGSPAWVEADPCDDAISRALRLLPRQPQKVVLVEGVDGVTRHKDKPNVEAFVRAGGAVVFLVRQGATLQAASKRGGIFDYALAAIIWHEMAHIDGADEPAAQRAEEQLWKEFVLSNKVDRGRAMRYLALLERRN
jgi:hypothetical protein